MDFGVFDHLDRNDLPLDDYYEARLQLVELYDQRGFYAYHLAEHHSTPLGMAPSPCIFLSAITQRTKRLRFGPLVLALPLYHPLRVIEEICMLDQLSNGRLEIGFGRGSSPIEIEYYGQKPEDAQAIYAESLELVIQGLTQKSLSFNGATYRIDNVPMELAPRQRPHPPIWYGVHSPDSAERAALKGLNTVSLDPVKEARISTDRFRSTWAQVHGPDAALPKLGLGRFIVVAPSDAIALELASHAYRRWLDSFTHLARVHNRPQVYARPPDFDSVMAAGQGIAGTPEKVAAVLRSQVAEARVNYLVGQFAFGDLPMDDCARSINLFSDHVMPALRDAAKEFAVA